MLKRAALILCLIAAACREQEEGHLSKISHGYHSTANVPGHDEVIEVEIPKGFAIDVSEPAMAIDAKGRSHRPKEFHVSQSDGHVNYVRVKVALPDDAQVYAIRIGQYTLDIKNSRVSKAKPTS